MAAPTNETYQYDAFIAYAEADRAWVRGDLLARLERAGIKVFYDQRDFRPGATRLSEIERAADQSAKTLFVLTPAFLASQWAEYSQYLVQTRDPTNRQLRFIPLIVEACELPAHLALFTPVNFVDPGVAQYVWNQILTALGRPPDPTPPLQPASEQWLLAHPYPMQANFTGRVAERRELSAWLEKPDGERLLALQALGGFGKSALTWHWLLHDVDPSRWPRVVWWSLYESEASFESFLINALEYLGVDPRGLGPRQHADKLLDLLRQPGTLLILDGFERALRAFSGMRAAYQGDETPEPRTPSTRLRTGENQEPGTQNSELKTQNHALEPFAALEGKLREGSELDCVSLIAEHFLRAVCVLPGIRGRVLLTTRLLPRVLEQHGALLEGCRELPLTQLDPADAVAFFRSQGVRGTHAEIETACAAYGYHPLSLRLLAGLVAKDPLQPGDIAAAQRYDVTGDLVQRRNHVLAQAYDSLTPVRRTLLSRIACLRGAVEHKVIEALVQPETKSEPIPQSWLDRLLARPQRYVEVETRLTDNFEIDLGDLIARGLLQHDRRDRRYDLHPIVRRYAYERMGNSERTSAHVRLRDYFAAVPPPKRVQRLDDLAPLIELYHHMVNSGQYDEAHQLFRERIHSATYYQFGAYELQIDLLHALFQGGGDELPRLGDENAQVWTFAALANSYGLSGRPRRAIALFERNIAIAEHQANKTNLIIILGSLAYLAQVYVGALRAAEANLRRSISLCVEIDNTFYEAIDRKELGRTLTYRGAWAEAQSELDRALVLNEKDKVIHGQGLSWAYQALLALLMLRYGEDRREQALSAAGRALELAGENAKQQFPVERDYVRAHWLIGAAQRVNGKLAEAERHLDEALPRCRGINMVQMEADILIDLARLRRDTGAHDEAQALAEEALQIAERCEYVLQGADAHLELAKLALDRGDEAAALHHAREARRLATCDGPPDYTYKVAYDEAGELLSRLGAAPE